MSWEMNWVDLVIIITLVFFAWEAYGRPLVAELLDLLSFLVAFFLSFRLYNLTGSFFEKNFSIPHGFSQALGFMSSWFLAEIFFYILVNIFLSKITKFKFRGEGFISIIPAMVRSLIFMAMALVFIGSFPIQPTIKRAVNESKLGSLILTHSYQLEQPIKSVFGGLTNDSLSFLTIKPKTNEKINLGFQTAEFSPDLATEDEMIVLVNKERASRGFKALTFDSKLREVARGHSTDMFKRGYFSHYSPEGESVADRVQKAGAEFLVIGENLAFAPSLGLAHQGLMNSEGHRANILSEDFNKIGIGVMDGGIYGRMFTQVFSD
mgnify:CR=1 FL=1